MKSTLEMLNVWFNDVYRDLNSPMENNEVEKVLDMLMKTSDLTTGIDSLMEHYRNIEDTLKTFLTKNMISIGDEDEVEELTKDIVEITKEIIEENPSFSGVTIAVKNDIKQCENRLLSEINKIGFKMSLNNIPYAATKNPLLNALNAVFSRSPRK